MTGSPAVLTVGAPLQGWCASLEDCPDEVFRGRMLGDGVSIDPTAGELCAPFAAEVLALPATGHAVNLKADNGAEFLLHVGIDTVGLGEVFTPCVRAGERVAAGQPLLRFDLDRLLRGATSLRTPVLLLHAPGYTVRQLRGAGPVAVGDPVFEVHHDPGADPRARQTASVSSGTVRREAVIGLEHGIHARPAAVLIEAVRSLDARVTLEYAGRKADVRSAVALMALATRRGARITVSASGPDAAAAAEAIVASLAPLSMEAQGPSGPDVAAPEAAPRVSPPADGSVILAVPASPGLARGVAVMLVGQAQEIVQPGDTPDAEWAALAAALECVREDLQAQASSKDGLVAELAGAHLALLADPMLVDVARHHVDRGQSAAAAWRTAVGDAVVALQAIANPRMRERADDLRDIDLRVQRALAGASPTLAPTLPAGAIVVADRLLPSQLLEFDQTRLAGVCLAGGGATAHVALLALSLQIPMLVAAGESILTIETGSDLLLDAQIGELHVRPGTEVARRFAERKATAERHDDEATRTAGAPCVTRDGVRIEVYANLASVADAREAVAKGAEGCGLLRTEFLFMDRPRAPGEDEQLRVYRDVAMALGERPLLIRLLDAGADKPISYLHQAVEENPALGLRGIRLGLAHPDLLETQLRAVARLEHGRGAQVLIPMVSGLGEVEAVKDVLARIRADGLGEGLQLGVMIETPAAALLAERLAGAVHFFSIGTNDLAQYTLCMDRGDPRVARDLDPLHPAVLRLVRLVVAAAGETAIPVSVCGAAAGDLLAAPLLLGLGIRRLSMPAGLIARQKAQLRKVSVAECAQLAEQALTLDSAAAVRALLRAGVPL